MVTTNVGWLQLVWETKQKGKHTVLTMILLEMSINKFV